MGYTTFLSWYFFSSAIQLKSPSVTKPAIFLLLAAEYLHTYLNAYYSVDCVHYTIITASETSHEPFV